MIEKLIICVTIITLLSILVYRDITIKTTELKIRQTIICGDTAELSSSCIEKITKAQGN